VTSHNLTIALSGDRSSLCRSEFVMTDVDIPGPTPGSLLSGPVIVTKGG
jgi:hypothetical protein